MAMKWRDTFCLEINIMLIVGSKALATYFEIEREPKDIDIIGSISDALHLKKELLPTSIKEGNGYISLLGIKNKTDIFDTENVEIFLSDNSLSLKGYLIYEGAEGRDIKISSREVLFSLKKSHINFPIYFQKHIKDYSLLNNFFKGYDAVTLDSGYQRLAAHRLYLNKGFNLSSHHFSKQIK